MLTMTYLRAPSLVVIKVKIYDIPHFFTTAIYKPVMPVKGHGTADPAHEPCHWTAMQNMYQQ